MLPPRPCGILSSRVIAKSARLVGPFPVRDFNRNLANPGAGIAMPADSSQRVACSIIKVGLLAAFVSTVCFFRVNSMKCLRLETRSPHGRCD